MNNLTFNNISNPNQNEEFRKSIERLQEISKKLSEKCSPALSPLVQMAKEMTQSSLEVINNPFYVALKELTNSIQTSEAVIAAAEAMKSISENALNSFNFSFQLIIEFTEENMQTIEDLNIDLDEYSSKEESNNKRRRFTKKTLIEVVGILLALISLIQNCIYHLEDDKQSRETARQIEELNESQKRTNELLETIIRQIPTETTEYTADEASN